ncbi:uncharacterized protein [Clytia hemisphaerica]|uniref:PhoD-like phosphatase metallophosphatase domain-containing protein n=1 Tax=Clytia hemisphaerica TaxID=252671 RepID=A0A7M5XEN4_9CNID
MFLIYASILLVLNQLVNTQNSDFHQEKVLETITFGSCNKHDKPQLLWDQIIKQDPNLWIWLGDAVYADTRILPMIWMPSPLATMKERFDVQKENEGYKKLKDETPIIGVWDDHDYGNNNGGKSYRNRLQSQNIFLDFLDEPADSIRRKREGVYVSYSYGTPGKIVKIILLDVRSHYEGGSSCDILGGEQWQWFKEQLDDPTASMFFIGTGLQVLSDIPFSEKWMACQKSLDRLIWLTQQHPKVMFLSGDVHFAEINCINPVATGYPIYEFTSSGMSHTCSLPRPHWLCVFSIKNVVASKYRISNVVTELNFGAIKIDWEKMLVSFQVYGVEGKLSQVDIKLADLQVKRNPSSCPDVKEQPNWYWKRVFWSSAVLLVILLAAIALRCTVLILRWVSMVVLKDLDMKIKHRLKKLRTQLAKVAPIRNGGGKNDTDKPHQD